MSMIMTKIKRVFENFTNSKTEKLIVATERTLGINPILTIHAMVVGESFPKKFQFDKGCTNAVLLNNRETDGLWVVVEEVSKKKSDGEGYWKNNWIRIAGTAAECAKYIEKNGVIKDVCGGDDDWAAQFGGTVKVYDSKPVDNKPSSDNGYTGGEGEVEEEFDKPE